MCKGAGAGAGVGAWAREGRRRSSSTTDLCQTKKQRAAKTNPCTPLLRCRVCTVLGGGGASKGENKDNKQGEAAVGKRESAEGEEARRGGP